MNTRHHARAPAEAVFHRHSSPRHAALEVRPSGITGRGLFTRLPIPARCKIGEFEGERISIAEARRRAAGRRVVAIVEMDRDAIDASRTRHGFRFINHSCAPNTYMRIAYGRIEFYALRAIAGGEELTVDYGLSHHDGRLPCRCNAPNCRGAI